MVLAQSVPIVGFDDTRWRRLWGCRACASLSEVARATLELLCDPADAEWSGRSGL